MANTQQEDQAIQVMAMGILLLPKNVHHPGRRRHEEQQALHAACLDSNFWLTAKHKPVTAAFMKSDKNGPGHCAL